MKLQHGALEQFAAAVEKANSAQRDAIVDTAGGLLCGH
jgi:hypothetical protein